MSTSTSRRRGSAWQQSLVAVMAAGMMLLLASPGLAAAQEPAPGPTEQSSAADETAGVCEAMPVVARPSCLIAEGAATAGGAVLGGAVATGADAALGAIVAWVVGGAAWLLGELIALIDSSTRPDVTAGWFSVAYQDMAMIAVLLMLPLLLLSIIQAVLRQDVTQLVKAVFVYVPVAAVGMFAAVVVVNQMVLLTDDLSGWIGRSTGADLSAFSNNVGEALVSTGAAGGPDQAIALPGFAALLGAAVIGFASFVIWVLLVLRQAAIYVAVLFVPLAFAALVWPTTAHWLRRLLEGLVAIVMSKFVIVAVMGLGAGALHAVADEGFGVLVSGGAMLLMAAFAPFVLLRFIPVFESGLSSQMEGTTNARTSPVAGPTAGGMYRGVQRARAASAAPGLSGFTGGGVASLASAGAATGMGAVGGGAAAGGSAAATSSAGKTPFAMSSGTRSSGGAGAGSTPAARQSPFGGGGPTAARAPTAGVPASDPRGSSRSSPPASGSSAVAGPAHAQQPRHPAVHPRSSDVAAPRPPAPPKPRTGQEGHL